MQIHADVSGVPIYLSQTPDAPALGSAILATVAAGLYPDIVTAAGQMSRIADCIEPDPKRHEQYQFYVEQYIATYPRLQPLMHEMARHQAALASSSERN
jgi:ribulose kinase